MRTRSRREALRLALRPREERARDRDGRAARALRRPSFTTEVLEAFAKNKLTLRRDAWSTILRSRSETLRRRRRTTRRRWSCASRRGGLRCTAARQLGADARARVDRRFPAIGVLARSRAGRSPAHASSGAAAAGEGRDRADDARRRGARVSQSLTSSRGRERHGRSGASARIVEPLGAYGDVVMSLEGLGEPLLHPALPPMVRRPRTAASRRPRRHHGATLDEAYVRAPGRVAPRRAERRPLGAHADERYKAIFGVDGLDARSQAAVESLLRSRRASAKRVADSARGDYQDARGGGGHRAVLRLLARALATGRCYGRYNDFAGQIDDLATIQLRTSAASRAARYSRSCT